MEVITLIGDIAWAACCFLAFVLAIYLLVSAYLHSKKHFWVEVEGEEFEHVVDFEVDYKRWSVSFYDMNKGEYVNLKFDDLRYCELKPVDPTDPEA